MCKFGTSRRKTFRSFLETYFVFRIDAEWKFAFAANGWLTLVRLWSGNKQLGNSLWLWPDKFFAVGRLIVYLSFGDNLATGRFARSFCYSSSHCFCIVLQEEELISQCMSPSTAGVNSFKLHNRAKHVYSEASRVLKFKNVCEEKPANAVQVRNIPTENWNEF